MRQVKTRMMADPAIPALDAQIAAAFDWWREAGVDCDYADAPQSWLAEPGPEAESGAGSTAPAAQRPAEPAAAPPPPVAAIDAASLPATLEAFAGWWLAEPLLDQGGASGRVPPRGPAGAEVMVIVPHPEREDSDTLLSGPQGALLSAMLAAMGIAPQSAYVASLLPRHTPHADWEAAWAAGLGTVLAHHVALAAPKRVVSFCGNILPLTGNDPTNSADSLRRFNHGDFSVPLLAERDLAAFLERPRWKAGFWRRWLDFAG